MFASKKPSRLDPDGIGHSCGPKQTLLPQYPPFKLIVQRSLALALDPVYDTMVFVYGFAHI